MSAKLIFLKRALPRLFACGAVFEKITKLTFDPNFIFIFDFYFGCIVLGCDVVVGCCACDVLLGPANTPLRTATSNPIPTLPLLPLLLPQQLLLPLPRQQPRPPVPLSGLFCSVLKKVGRFCRF